MRLSGVDDDMFPLDGISQERFENAIHKGLQTIKE